MNRILLVAASMLLAAPSALAAQSLEGNWTNPKRSVIVKVDRCGEGYCGTVSWASQHNRDKVAGEGRQLVGTRILTDLKPAGDGQFKGQAFEPKRNIRGSATVHQLGANTMVVKGCAVLGLFCREQRWTRVVD
ncbi:DUF2147 domain-containing protein [Sphingomonas sp.]|uniref:DUF2147 domain-containing protein n=1 Tax=Sphingomonas sp. TaxID=28214 RepID=UPI0025F954F7|nr:DUF2147 domain-containing protein [Sphingomonas sp.]